MSADDPATAHDEPVDRLTRLCKTAIEAIEADPEFTDNIKGIIMLNDGDRGGLAMTGYLEGGGREAFGDLFVHLHAIAEANGIQIHFMGIPDTIEGVEG
jgi:hypothetical protein